MAIHISPGSRTQFSSAQDGGGKIRVVFCSRIIFLYTYTFGQERQ